MEFRDSYMIDFAVGEGLPEVEHSVFRGRRKLRVNRRGDWNVAAVGTDANHENVTVELRNETGNRYRGVPLLFVDGEEGLLGVRERSKQYALRVRVFVPFHGLVSILDRATHLG